MRFPRRFTFTEQHIALLRHMYVDWRDAEAGAPEIDPKRPYGNSAVEDDVAEILGVPRINEPENEDESDARELQDRDLLALHEQTATALQIVLNTGEFRPGVYERPDEYDTRTWRRIGE